MKKIKTYLPIFSGFYNSIFESDCEDQEIYEINQIRKEKKLSEIDFDDCDFDYDTYYKEVSIRITEHIQNKLNDINILTKIEFESLDSPQYYNYSNDIINVTIHLTNDNIKEIKKIIYDNLDLYKEYLKDNYTSFDGFISFYSNSFNDWLKITKDFTDYKSDYHHLGSVLNFICNLNGINESILYDSMVEESILLNCTNYDKLIKE